MLAGALKPIVFTTVCPTTKPCAWFILSPAFLETTDCVLRALEDDPRHPKARGMYAPPDCEQLEAKGRGL
jgi:hypothetical protein